MSTQNSSPKVPLGQKIAFGLGMLANQMFPAALGIFMVVLVENLGMPSWMWGILFFVPRIVDAFFDPVMGFISDNTRSVWGRRRQYVFIGSIIMGIAFMLMWQLYREDSVMYNFIFFLTFSLIFHIGLSIFSVPYVAMGYEMSDDFHERTSIMAISQWIGQFAWVIAPWFWVIMYDPTWFPNADTATRTLAVWVGAVFMLLAMVPAVFIKSKSTTFDDTLQPLTYKTIGGSLKEILISFREAFSNKPFRKLCIATFFIFNAFNTVAGFTFFIIVYYLFNGDTEAAGVWPTLFGCGGALATTFIVIPIVAWMAKKAEKKKAFLICQGISVFGYVLLWFLFIPGKPYMFLFALPFFSFGIGSLFTLMMSMTADVCDMDELDSGKRREGVFGAIYWWMVKFGFAIAGLLTGVIMSAVAFKAGASTQPEGAITGLRLFFSGVPIFGTLIAMWVMRNYDLTESKAKEIKELLQAKKAKGFKGSSAYPAGKLHSLVHHSGLNQVAGYEYSLKNDAEMNALFAVQFQSGMHGLCFSPYEEGQKAGDVLSREQISRRIDIIAPHTRWVRTFSCTGGNEWIPEMAHRKQLKVMAGAWISHNTEQNERELSALIRLANDGLVDVAAVGNEVLHRGDISESALIDYIRRVKQTVPDHVKVGYVDAYYQFTERPALVDACDLLLCNFYPFWEGAPVEQTVSYLSAMLEVTHAVSQGKQIIVTETGWPSEGEIIEKAVPSRLHAMYYFIMSQQWATDHQVELFHFSAFDESWKATQEGRLGTSWGLWDKNENLKYTH